MEVNQQYLTNEFLERLYEKIQPEKDLLSCEEQEIEPFKKEQKRKLRDILKIDELNQMFHKELIYEYESNMESMGITIDKYKLEVIEGLDFPVYHIKPLKPNGKTVFYLHGHDDLGIMGGLLERTDKVRYHKMIPVKMALEGYDVIAPELIGYGESGFWGFPKGEERICGCLINDKYLTLAGFSIVGFRVYQSMRTLDWVEKMELGDNITGFGISGGGMICQHISVLDDRIRKVLVACYSNTYKHSILAKEHCTDNYVPGLLRIGDSYKLLSLAAPKPMLTVNGIWDRGFPQEGSKIAFEYLKNVYEHLGVEERYEGILFEGRHEIDEQIIIDWLNRQA